LLVAEVAVKLVEVEELVVFAQVFLGKPLEEAHLLNRQ
jgi:hypothetical protein